MNEKQKWFITYSEVGACDPNGFFCPTCFMGKAFEFRERYSEINPENTPHYTCNVCNKDYRDEKI